MRTSIPYVCPLCGSRLPRAAAQCFFCEHPLPIYKGPATAGRRRLRSTAPVWLEAKLPSVVMTADDHLRLKRLARMVSTDDVAARLLRSELDRATVLYDDDLEPDVVRIGSEIVVHDKADGLTVENIRGIVLEPDERNRHLPLIPVTSPLGAAVLGLRVGDSMPYTTADDLHHVVTITKVSPPANPVDLRDAGSTGHEEALA